MPNGILIIKMDPFISLTADELAARIDAYFNSCDAIFKPLKKTREKTTTDGPGDEAGTEPATLTGLALSLGFNSRQEFEDHEQNGPFASQIKRARLRIEAIYEKKLHQQSPTGAMFALKSFGWDDRRDSKPENSGQAKTLTIEIVETGFQPSGTENEVVL